MVNKQLKYTDCSISHEVNQQENEIRSVNST